MSKQSDLVTVARDAGASGYVNVTGDTMTGELTAPNLKITGTSSIYGDNTIASFNIASGNTSAPLNFYTGEFGVSANLRLGIDTAGRVTMPYQPMFTARGYNGLSGGFQLYDVVDFDIGNNFNNTNGRFTAPIAGTYFASFGSGYKAAENYLGYGLNKNGTQLYLSWSGNQTNENHQFNGGGFLVSMSASDYLQVSVSSGYTTPDTSTIYSYFSVYLVG